MIPRTASLFFLLAAIAFPQTASTGSVTTTIVPSTENVGARRAVVQFVAVYPDTLAPEEYPDFGAVAIDLVNYLRNVPNRQLATEAYATGAAKALLDKYPVMTGVRVILVLDNNGSNLVEAERFQPKVTPNQKESLRAVKVTQRRP